MRLLLSLAVLPVVLGVTFPALAQEPQAFPSWSPTPTQSTNPAPTASPTAPPQSNDGEWRFFGLRVKPFVRVDLFPVPKPSTIYTPMPRPTPSATPSPVSGIEGHPVPLRSFDPHMLGSVASATSTSASSGPSGFPWFNLSYGMVGPRAEIVSGGAFKSTDYGEVASPALLWNWIDENPNGNRLTIGPLGYINRLVQADRTTLTVYGIMGNFRYGPVTVGIGYERKNMEIPGQPPQAPGYPVFTFGLVN